MNIKASKWDMPIWNVYNARTAGWIKLVGVSAELTVLKTRKCPENLLEL